MDGPQQFPGPETAEAAQARHAQNKRRAAVVAEQQQAAGLRPGYPLLPVQLGHGAGSHRIAAHQAQQKRPGSGGAAAQHPGQQHPPPRQQPRYRQKREQRRNHRPGAQGQSLPDGPGRVGGAQQQHPQRSQTSQQPQLFPHGRHLPPECMPPAGGTCKFFPGDA